MGQQGAFDVVVGLDVGKAAHHAVALDRDGRRLVDREVANTEEDLRAVLARAGQSGRILVVVDQLNSLSSCHDETHSHRRAGRSNAGKSRVSSSSTSSSNSVCRQSATSTTLRKAAPSRTAATSMSTMFGSRQLHRPLSEEAPRVTVMAADPVKSFMNKYRSSAHSTTMYAPSPFSSPRSRRRRRSAY